MRQFSIYLIYISILCSCQLSSEFELLQLERAVDKTGIVENYSFDQSKPKVVTYIGSMEYFSPWLKQNTSNNYLKTVIAKYDKFEFLFYLRVTSTEELDRVIELANRYSLETPIYIDYKDEFRDKNIDSDKIQLVTYILDPDNKTYLSTVLGFGSISNFEDSMQNAIEQIKLSYEGL